MTTSSTTSDFAYSFTRPPAPYPGLRPFNKNEWMIYFGRESMTETVIGLMMRQRLVTIHGDSGCGKSSLIKAGVLPFLDHDQARSKGSWRTSQMRPLDNPLVYLSRALAELQGDKTSDAELQFQRLLSHGAAGVKEIAKRLRRGPSDYVCILLDQFEELFDHDRKGGGEDARIVVEFLNGVATLKPSGLHAIITMRSDFLGQCADYEGFAETVNATQYLVPRMERPALLRAVREPARLYGGAVDAELANRLIADAGTGQDQLPLLQHGLMQLWHQKTAGNAEAYGWRLEVGDYQLSVSRAISAHADSIVREVAQTDGERLMVKHLFRALIDTGAEGKAIRRPQCFAALVQVTGGDREALLRIVNRFRKDDCSFLRPYGDAPLADSALVDISHEALIRHWDSIADPHTGWLAREVEDGQVWKMLRFSAGEFREDPRQLFSGPLAEQRLGWLGTLNAPWAERYGGGWTEVIAFLKKGVSEDERTQRQSQRRRSWVLALVSLVAVIGVIASWYLRDLNSTLSAQQKSIQEQIKTVRFTSDQLERAQHQITEQLRQMEESLRITAEAQRAAERFDYTKNVQLILRALPANWNPPDRPIIGLAARVLYDTIGKARERKQFRGHANAVENAVFSPDGSRILTASSDNTARLWDAKGEVLAVLKGHEDSVWSAVFSPDGSRILTASSDKTARLWDAKGEVLAVLKGHEDSVISAVFNGDGSRILTASGDTTARLWDAKGTELAVLKGHENWVRSAVFSGDGSRILTASEDKTARLWDAKGTELAVLKGHEDFVNSAVFSPDGSRILTASGDTTARLWDAKGNELAVLKGHAGPVSSAVFSGDGSRILTASDDNTARLWDAKGNELAVLKGHGDRVNSAVFSGDGSRILTASLDNTARLWDAKGTELAVLKGHGDRVNSAVFSGDGSRILTASDDNTARLWDAKGNEFTVLKGHEGRVYSAVFSPDGSRILTASGDRTARLWDAKGTELAVLKGHGDRVNSAVFSPDGSRILTASDDNTARLWDAKGNELAVLKGHESRVISAVFSPDGSRILTASSDITARLWDAKGAELAVLRGHESFVSSAVFSGDGSRILTASGDKTARLWDAKGAELAVLKGHEDSVWSAVFSPDGSSILTASGDKTARLWDAKGAKLAVLRGHESYVNSAVFSGDGSRILTASSDNTARLWDAKGAELAVLKGHENRVISAVFSPDGSRILTASDDNTARLWDAKGAELAVLKGHEDSVTSAVFSPDGRLALTASIDGTARIWRYVGPLRDVMKAARCNLPRDLTDEEERAYFLAKPSSPPPDAAALQCDLIR